MAFVNGRLDVGLIGPQLGQLPNLEVDGFRFDGRSGGYALASWRLVPPDAPALEQHSLAFATASPDFLLLGHVPYYTVIRHR